MKGDIATGNENADELLRFLYGITEQYVEPYRTEMRCGNSWLPMLPFRGLCAQLNLDQDVLWSVYLYLHDRDYIEVEYRVSNHMLESETGSPARLPVLNRGTRCRLRCSSEVAA